MNDLHGSRFDHPLLDGLDEIETTLYRMGQETKGDPDPATRDSLERWHPNEFTFHVTQQELEEAGGLLFEACDKVSKALKLLTADHPREAA